MRHRGPTLPFDKNLLDSNPAAPADKPATTSRQTFFAAKWPFSIANTTFLKTTKDTDSSNATGINFALADEAPSPGCHNNLHNQRNATRDAVSSTAVFHSSSTTTQRGKTSMSEFRGTKPIKVPKYDFREIKQGSMVGRGGFSDVRDVEGIEIQEVFDTSEEETQMRQAFAAKVNDKSENAQRYVLKCLRTDLPEEEHTKGILDLAIESEMLSRLQHENIITLRAMANSDPHESRFFVILERLSATLERKFNYWRTVAEEAGGFYLPCYGYCCAQAPLLHSLWKERLLVTLQIARALDYLHQRGIVFRDLKPDNIGFDSISSTVKLFDFGLATRVQAVEQLPDGTYRLTGHTGSLRYMAPEVAKNQPYDLSVDAYSFGILFWQICSLTTPYAKYSTKMHSERVIFGGQRPTPDPTWPPTWIQLQQSCWAADRKFRPRFGYIAQTLQQQVDDMEDGVIPNRAWEIRAKRKKKQVASDVLDVDTRKAAPLQDPTEIHQRFPNDVV